MTKFVPYESGKFVVKLAETKEELEQAYKLRYEELLLFFNKDNTNDSGLFIDEYDPLCDHLICINKENNEVAGTYRLVMRKHIKSIGHFITEKSYDLSNLKDKSVVELGRAVVKEKYRDGIAISLLWRGVLQYVKANKIQYLFGTGSFSGLNTENYAHALSYLYYNHLSPLEVRAYAKGDTKRKMDILSEADIDPIKAKEEMPPLIKGYIKIGATFGNDVFLDVPFNSTDVLILLDLNDINPAIAKRLVN